jgi:hypothetical protein
MAPNMPAPVVPNDWNSAKTEPCEITPPSPAYIVAAIDPVATPVAVNPTALITDALIVLIIMGVEPAAMLAIIVFLSLSFSS